MQRILDASSATPDFKADVAAFSMGQPAPRIGVLGYAPRVKVERVLTQLLHAEPDLAIESVQVEGLSGCSDFTGVAEVVAAGETHRFAFTWCCRWRAEQEGWTDYFGFPDQIRAAREFGWDCFQQWEVIPAPELILSCEEELA